MNFPAKSPETMDWFRELMAAYPEVTIKPMFGQVAAFVNGNLAAGTFGDQVMLRLNEADRAELIEHHEAEPFEPMPGRPMKEYVVAPADLRDDEAVLRDWLDKSLAYTGSLPPKRKK